jgi:hypothetical protein
MQVCGILITRLLMVVFGKAAATKKSFANMITLTRLNLTPYVDLMEFIQVFAILVKKQTCVFCIFTLNNPGGGPLI